MFNWKSWWLKGFDLSCRQIIEISGLTGLLQTEEDKNTNGEKQILTGVWVKLIGQLLEALSVTRQIYETDQIKFIQEQKVAIAGDLLAALGSAIEVLGGINVLYEEGTEDISIIVP